MLDRQMHFPDARELDAHTHIDRHRRFSAENLT